jgi:hypothetical protein
MAGFDPAIRDHYLLMRAAAFFVLDDWLLFVVTPEQSRSTLEVIEG